MTNAAEAARARSPGCKTATVWSQAECHLKLCCQERVAKQQRRTEYRDKTRFCPLEAGLPGCSRAHCPLTVDRPVNCMCQRIAEKRFLQAMVVSG